MSYGRSPYDKRSIGKILFFVIIIILVLALISGGLVFMLLENSNKNEESNDVITDDSSILLQVVNIHSPVEADYIPQLSDCNGVKINTLAYDSLSALLSEAKQQKIDLKIKSAYISYDEQKKLFDDTLQKYLSDSDYTQVRAEAAAQRETAQSGCSEAQLGLLVDFDLSDEHTKAFVERKCVNYGFVLRYPEDKTVLTKRNASDTVYRFVGKDNAAKMRAFEMCLEEYNSYLNARYPEK